MCVFLTALTVCGPCNGIPPGSYAPDPTDCAFYYVCPNIRLPCLLGQLYDQVKRTCKSAGKVRCSQVVKATTSQQAATPSRQEPRTTEKIPTTMPAFTGNPTMTWMSQSSVPTDSKTLAPQIKASTAISRVMHSTRMSKGRTIYIKITVSQSKPRPL